MNEQLILMQRYGASAVHLLLSCGQWHCHVDLKDEGLRIEIREMAASPEAAVAQAAARFDKLIERGVFNPAGLIEHQPPAPSDNIHC